MTQRTYGDTECTTIIKWVCSYCDKAQTSVHEQTLGTRAETMPPSGWKLLSDRTTPYPSITYTCSIECKRLLALAIQLTPEVADSIRDRLGDIKGRKE